MGYKNREIEKKFVVNKLSLSKTFDKLKKILPCFSFISESSVDFYWKTNHLNSDFLRIRHFPADDHGQLTLKHTDKKTIIDRVEIDVEINNASQGNKFLEYLMDKKGIAIRKKYHVFFLNKGDSHDSLPNVSIYSVKGDKRVFLEIEAKTLNQVDGLKNLLSKKLDLSPESRSLYKIFIKGE